MLETRTCRRFLVSNDVQSAISPAKPMRVRASVLLFLLRKLASPKNISRKCSSIKIKDRQLIRKCQHDSSSGA